MVTVHTHETSGAGRRIVRLAPGIELRGSGSQSASTVLVSSGGKVHLNQHALAILQLCDGSRNRDRVVVDAMFRTGGSMRAADVTEFLDAARARGWIVEG